MADFRPEESYPYVLRPFVRWGLIGRHRAEDSGPFWFLILYGLGLVGTALVLVLAAPAILAWLLVRWVMRWLGAWE